MKFKLADNVADPLGVGLYIEPSIRGLSRFDFPKRLIVR